MQLDDAEQASDVLRGYPIGEDSKGQRYYHFSSNHEDCRLYREEPPKR
jgi:hypothetical protein